MGRIHKLTGELANQIAAGEVVERPASVVKELVENAVDAGASRVVVDVEQGGSTLVRVSDDGEGMTRDDAVLALERHATSKIDALDDLLHLKTFGFRGEALPSIASVSRLLLRTRPREHGEACEVEVLGGASPLVRPAGGPVGTTVEVRELFYNVPARRKFLKATATESAHIGDVVLGAALARPYVTFVLSRDGRVVRELLRMTTRRERAAAAHGTESLAHVQAERGTLRLEGMLAPPERARAGATGLSLLVNGRPVRDRLVARAVAQAYGSVLEGGRYPLGVVWIDVPTEAVDVNVHPQKAEVRFADGRGVFDAITRELHASLARVFGLPALGAHPYASSVRGATPTLPALGAAAQTARDMTSGAAIPMWRRLDEGAAVSSIAEPRPMPAENLFASGAAQASDPLEGRGVYAALRFVGQVRGTFLVCEGDDAVYFLDQHAAAERVTFDRLRRAHAARTVEMQRLLVPAIVELTAAEVAIFEEHAESIARLGVETRAVGETALAVHGVPALLRRAEPARIVRDLASELSLAGGRAFAGAVDLVLATMACHGSIRAGDAVAPEEARALLAALDKTDFAGHCPHGRPVVMRLPYNELSRSVGR